MIWQQSLKGRVIDLVNPTPAQVDFEEIAMTLARINRYGGASETPVPVALHTLIALSACGIKAARPYVLLHDAHEAYVGDITSPMAAALLMVSNQIQPGSGYIVTDAIRDIKFRHDQVIWQRAGLEPPSPEIHKEIHRVDMVALQTERRDFLAPAPRPWQHNIEIVMPLDQDWRAAGVLCPGEIAEFLIAAFQQELPAAAFLPYSAP